MPQAASTDFPLLVMVNGNTRHEVLLVSPTTSRQALSEYILEATSSSPNCQEFMGKYKAKNEESSNEEVVELKMRWSQVAREPKMWPQSTIITEDNIDAVLMMVERSGVGRDFLEVKLAEKGSKKWSVFCCRRCGITLTTGNRTLAGRPAILSARCLARSDLLSSFSYNTFTFAHIDFVTLKDVFTHSPS